MRSGDAGSISPAGDLFAFGICIVIVLSLSSMVPLLAGDGPGDEGLPPRTLSAILAWRGWDRNGDGVLESESLREIFRSDGFGAPFDDDLVVVISYAQERFEFQFHEGDCRPCEGQEGFGIRHSLRVLVEEKGEYHPGTMTVGRGGGPQ